MLVFELSGTVSLSALHAAGLAPLGGTQRQAVVAFADDPQLAAFLERVRAYRAAGDDAESAPYEGFVDVLDSIRAYGPQDRLTQRIEARRSEVGPGDELDVHLDLWHPGDIQLANAWVRETSEAIQSADGEVLDTYLNHRSGLLLIRARIPEPALDDLAQVDEIALIDGLPRFPPSRAHAKQASLDDLPRVLSPASDAPLVGIVDSGVQSAHPLLAGAVYDATTLSSEFGDGEDEHGHGTRIAGLLLHGPLDDVLDIDVLPPPLCRLMSVRVLGSDNCFPANVVWEAEVERAIRHCAEQGARVICLSIGDPDTAYEGARSTPVAALIDELSRELRVVIVVPTGNVQTAAYLSPGDQDGGSYVDAMVQSDQTTMLDPAPATTALTVGALAPDALAGAARASFAATRRALGEGGWPSPFSRHGPGIDASVKPELSAPGGSLAMDLEFGSVVEDDALGIVSSSGKSSDRILDIDIGTSYAAPLVARVAGAVTATYPEFKANLVRALTLLGSSEPRYLDAIASIPKRDRDKLQFSTVGYGEPRLSETITSTPHRAILVAEDEIRVDSTMLYEVPVPTSFQASGGARGIDIALAFDPLTRARRLDYAATKMKFWLVRGMSAEEISEVFTSADQDALEELESLEAQDADEQAGDETEERRTPSKLGRCHVALSPSGLIRSRGANQLARRRFGQRLPNGDGDTYHLVVQCRRVWASKSFRQSFGLAVALWRDEGQPEIYNEIKARVELPVELPVEIEIRR